MNDKNIASNDEKDLWEKYQNTKDQKIRDYFIKKYYPIVKKVAKKILKNNHSEYELNDLISFGTFGLIDAIERYKLSKNKENNFETYAYKRIKGAIIDEIRRNDILPRHVKEKIKKIKKILEELQGKSINEEDKKEEIKKRLKISDMVLKRVLLKMKEFPHNGNNDFFYRKNDEKQTYFSNFDLITTRNSLDPLSILEKKEEKMIIKKAIEELPERERKIIILHYYYNFNFTEIGKMFNLSGVYISILHKRTLLELKDKLLSLRK